MKYDYKNDELTLDLFEAEHMGFSVTELEAELKINGFEFLKMPSTIVIKIGSGSYGMDIQKELK